MSNPGRKKNPATLPVEDTTNYAHVAANAAALPEFAQRTAEVAALYGDGTVYERERVITEAKYLMAASAEAMLEAGKRLIQIKENEPHGEFVEIVEERLGLGERSAQRMMVAAVKYLSPRLGPKATALSVLGKTKLFDLAFEADDDLAALAEGGTLAGHSLGEIEAMTSRELQAALRKTRDDVAAKDRLLEDKNKKIDKLTTEAEFRLAEPTEAQLKELASTTNACEVDLIRLAQVVGDMASSNSAPLRQRATQAVQYLVAHLADLIEENHIEVSLAEGLNVRPEWLRTLPAEPDATDAAEPKGKKTKPAR